MRRVLRQPWPAATAPQRGLVGRLRRSVEQAVTPPGDLGVFGVVRPSRGKDATMDLAFFGQGLALGLAVAAPVGPMSLLCIRWTLAAGFATGLFSGLGIATADALYGAIAAFGLV